MTEVTFSISGISCGDYAKKVEKALLAQKGVKAANANSVLAQTVVTYDPAAVASDDLKKSIENLGFAVEEIRDNTGAEVRGIPRVRVILVVAVGILLGIVWIMRLYSWH
ncbi:MAG: heavy-metal-associated domain-containing protein, partial [Candidatus Latescibacterota bacterium]